MEKQIDFDGYNVAKLKSIDSADTVLCDLECRDESGVVTKRDTDISFNAGNWPFELADEEIEAIRNNITNSVEDESTE
jgi:hypothetical protein